MLLINLIKLTLIHPHLQLTLIYNTTDATAISMCDTKQRQSRLHIPSVLHMHVQTLFDLISSVSSVTFTCMATAW